MTIQRLVINLPPGRVGVQCQKLEHQGRNGHKATHALSFITPVQSVPSVWFGCGSACEQWAQKIHHIAGATFKIEEL